MSALLAVAACSDDTVPSPDAGARNPDAGASQDARAAPTFVYVESNDPAGNAILTFERNADGTLAPTGSKVATGGIGLTAGADQRLGPLDSDRELVLSSDKKLLFAVNSGDHTVAVFHTAADGSLTPVAGSPFVTGGKNPVSVAQAGDVLYVLNKEADGNGTPTFTALAIGPDGALDWIADSAVASDGSPAIAYPTPDGKLLIGTRFLDTSRAAQAPARQIESFVIGDDGTLTAAPGSPYALPAEDSPAPPVALGAIAHPSQKILYIPFATRAELGVYTYADSGALTFVRAVPNSGKAICWLLIDRDAKHLYTVNSASATVSLYDLTDAQTPNETSHVLLKNAGADLSSQGFQLAFDKDESHIYVVSQRASTDLQNTAGNFLHVLTVAADGTLAEPGSPIDFGTLGVPATARPQGIAIF